MAGKTRRIRMADGSVVDAVPSCGPLSRRHRPAHMARPETARKERPLPPPLETVLEDGIVVRTEARQRKPVSRGRYAVTMVIKPGRSHPTLSWPCDGPGPVCMQRMHDEVVALAIARSLDYQQREDDKARWRAAHPDAAERARVLLAPYRELQRRRIDKG